MQSTSQIPINFYTKLRKITTVADWTWAVL